MSYNNKTKKTQTHNNTKRKNKDTSYSRSRSKTPDRKERNRPRKRSNSHERKRPRKDRRRKDYHSSSNSSSSSRSRSRSREDVREIHKNRLIINGYEQSYIEPHKLQTSSIDNPLEKIQLTFKSGQSVVQNKLQSQQIPIVLNLKCLPLTETTLPPKRAGIDIICVIDVSGSMGGQKLNLLKESLNYIVNMLKEQDRLCIIKFNDSAKIVFPLLSMDGAHKKIALRHISALRAIGGTNLMAALQAAFKVLITKEFKNNLESVFFLSDGLDSSSQSYSLKMPAMYASLPRSGAGLFFGSSPSINYGFSLQSTYNKCKQLLEMKAPSFTIHTFGYGEDHDSKLMIDLAKMRDGSYHYISKFEVLKESIASCLGGLFTVIASRIDIQVKNPTLKSISSFGSSIMNNMFFSGKFNIALTQVFQQTIKNFVFLLDIPPSKSGQIIKDVNRNQLILMATANITPVWGSIHAVKKIQSSLSLDFFSMDQHIEGGIKLDDEVIQQYWRIKSIQTWQQSERMISMGRVSDARINMGNFRNMMNQVPVYNNSLMLQSIDKDMFKIDQKIKNNRTERAQKMIHHKRRQRSRQRDCKQNRQQRLLVRQVVEDRGYSVSNDED